MHALVPSKSLATAVRLRSIARVLQPQEPDRLHALVSQQIPRPALPPSRCPTHLDSSSGEAEVHRDVFTKTGARPSAPVPIRPLLPLVREDDTQEVPPSLAYASASSSASSCRCEEALRGVGGVMKRTRA